MTSPSYKTVFNSDQKVSKSLDDVASHNPDFSSLLTMGADEAADLIRRYVKREDVEAGLLQSMLLRTENNLVVLLGPEGVGKSSTSSYSLGYRARMTLGAAAAKSTPLFEFVIVNCHSFIGCREVPDFVTQIYKALYTKIFIAMPQQVKQFDFAITGLQVPIPSLIQSGQANSSVTLREEFVANFFAYLSESNGADRKKIIICFDNTDQLVAATQLKIFEAISKVLIDIETARASFVVQSKLEDNPLGSLAVLLPLRPETFQWVTKFGGAFWPAPGLSYEVIEIAGAIDPWDLIFQNLEQAIGSLGTVPTGSFVNYLAGEENAAIVGVGSDQPMSQLSDYFLMIRRQLGNLDDLICDITGWSGRRSRILAVKAITHPYLAEGFIDINKRGRKENIPQAQLRFLNGLFDFRQPTIGKRKRDWFRMVLNPFNVVREAGQKEASPLLGWVTLHLIEKNLLKQQVEGNAADVDADTSIVQPLLNIGYDKEAVELAISCFRDCGMLRVPIGIAPSGLLPEIAKEMYCDPRMVMGYVGLVRARNPTTSIAFFEQCYRDIIGDTGRRAWHDNRTRISHVLNLVEYLLAKQERLKAMVSSRPTAQHELKGVPTPGSLLLGTLLDVLDTQFQKIRVENPSTMHANAFRHQLQIEAKIAELRRQKAMRFGKWR